MVEGVGREEASLLELTLKSLRSHLCPPFSSFSPVSVASERPKVRVTTVGIKKLGNVEESLASSLRKKCESVCVCGVCVWRAVQRQLDPHLLSYLHTFQKMPKVENLCLYC